MDAGRGRCKDYFLANMAWKGNGTAMPKHDANKTALRQVESSTDSPRVKGEDLIKSPALKRKFKDAKSRLQPSGK